MPFFIDKITREYPVPRASFRTRYPNVSFPAGDLDAETLAIVNLAQVVETVPPAVTATQRLVEGEPEQRVDGDWYQTWAVQDMGEEEVTAMVEQTRAEKIVAAAAACDAVLAPLGVEYGRWETATWDQQYAEAVALMADPTAAVPLVAALSQARGMDVAVLAQRIIRNRETWSVLTGAVVGRRLAIVDRINAATTVEEVAAVDVAITLPE